MQEALNRSHLSHKMRVALVAELNKSGWSIPRIIGVFSGMVDFDRRKTEYQVKNIVGKGYSPFKCSTIMQEGECLHEECGIYRRKAGIPLKPITGWGVAR